MLTLSLRTFRLKANEYMDKLPLTLTVYGKPVATVNTLGGAKIKKTGTIPVENKVNMKEEVKKDEAELIKQERLKKAREALASISKMKSVPMFCPKHGVSRIGNSYSCGCSI